MASEDSANVSSMFSLQQSGLDGVLRFGFGFGFGLVLQRISVMTSVIVITSVIIKAILI
jgi:hypothetical protein